MAERTVSWKALADFSKARREADLTAASLANLRREQERLNASSAGSAASSNDASSGIRNQVQAMRDLDRQNRTTAGSSNAVATGIRGMGTAAGDASGHIRDVSNQARDATGRWVAMGAAARKAGKDTDDAGNMAGRAVANWSNLGTALHRTSDEWRRHNQAQRQAVQALERTGGAVLKFGAIIPLAGSAIDVLAAGVSNLTAGLVGLAGAVAPAFGALATLPGLITAGAGAVGTLIAGFGGIGGALKAYGQQQKATQATQASNVAQNQAATLANTAAEDARQNAQQIRTAEQQVAKARLDAARQAQDDARAVQEAEQGVRDAEVQGASQIIQAQQQMAATRQSAARDIIAAENDVTRAQQQDQQAERDLIQARIDAKRSIEDLRNSLRGQKLDEEGASLSLEEAQLRYRRVLNDPTSTDLQRREAELAVDQAKYALDNTKKSTQDLQKQYSQASKAGVEGSQQVVAAKQAEAQADQAVRDAERNLQATRQDAAARIASAQQQLAQTTLQATRGVQQAQQQLAAAELKRSRDSVDNTRTIQNAQKDLANTLKEVQLRNQRLAIEQANVARSAVGTSAAATAYTNALKELSPAAQAVVKYLVSIRKEWQTIQKTAQTGMLPGFLDFLKGANRLFPQVNGFVRVASREFGDFFSRVADTVKSGGFLSDFNKVIDSSEKLIGFFVDAAYNTGAAIGNIMVAAIPLTNWLGKMADNWTKTWKSMTSGEANRKKLSDFFDHTRQVLAELGSITMGVGTALYNVFKSASPAGQVLLDSLDTTAQHWADWSKSLQGRNAIKDWADNAVGSVQQLGLLFEDLVKLIGHIGQDVDFAGFVRSIRKDLLPALQQFLDDLKPGASLNAFVQLVTDLVGLFDAVVRKLGGAGEVIDLLDQLVGIFTAIIDNTPAGVIKAVIAAMVIGKVASFANNLFGVGAAFKLLADKNSALRQAIGLFGHFADNADRVARSAKHAGDVIEGSGAAPKRAAGGAAEGAAGAAGGGIMGKLGGLLKGGGKIAGFGAAAGVVEVGGEAAAGTAATGVGIPIAIGIAIVAALAIAVILIVKYWKQIKSAFSAAYGWIKREGTRFGGWFLKHWHAIWDPIWRIVAGPFHAVERVISYFIRYAVATLRVAWRVITTMTQIAWNLWKRFVLDPVVSAVTWVGRHLAALVLSITRALGRAINWVQQHWVKPFRDHVVSPVVDALKPVGRAIQNIFDRITGTIGRMLSWIGRHLATLGRILAGPFEAVWKNRLKPILDSIWHGVRDAMNHINDWMGKLGGWASAAFSKFTKAVSDPVGFVVNHIINPGIINPYNRLADTFNMDHVRPIAWKPPKPPGREGGGHIPGHHSARRDNVLAVDNSGNAVARVEPGEYVLPRWMSPIFPEMDRMRRSRKLYADGGRLESLDSSYIQMLKKRKRGSDGFPGLLGYRGGGVIDAVKNAARSATGIGLTRPINAPISNGLHDQSTGFPAVDASASVGHPVVAGHSGRVAKSYDIRGYEPRRAGPQDGYRSYGRVIEVDSGSFKTLYAHLSQRQAKVGDTLKTGQQLGLSGNTGNTTGPHLHFGAQGINPTSFWRSGFGRIIDALRGAVTGVAGVVADPMSALKIAWNAIKGKIAGGVGKSAWGRMVGKIPGNIFNGILNWAKSRVFGGKDPGGSGVGRWAGTVKTALGMLHLPQTAAWIGAWLRQIQSESGGNPKAVQGNIGDINNLTGNLAEGLVQVIPPTFRSYHLAGHGNIFNGLDNLLAGMNYAKHAYGVKRMLSVIGHGHGYARGTNSASPDWRLVGENGPELVKFKGGEQVVPTHKLPGYDAGGVVRGFRPGADARWVAALRSQLMLGDSIHWGVDLTRALRARNGVVGQYHAPANIASRGAQAGKRMAALAHRHPNGRWNDWDWIANLMDYDPSRLWRYWSQIAVQLNHAKLPRAQRHNIDLAHNAFVHRRTSWVQSLGRELGLSGVARSGIWDSSISAPLRHIIAHGFGWKVGTHGHGEWSTRPWKAWTTTELQRKAAEDALAELTRSNTLNAEWDKILRQLTTWGFSYAVRKLGDVGVSDGLDTARGLYKNKTLASRYNAAAKTELDRSDAQSGDLGNASRDAQVIAILNALRTNPAGMGLNALAGKVSLSEDTVANLVDYINTGRKWSDIPSNKQTRLIREAGAFASMFNFTGGYATGTRSASPGWRWVGENGPELMKFKGGEPVLNMTGMNAMTMPALAAMRGGGHGDIVNHKEVHYHFDSNIYNPIAEPSGLSVQKRVTSIARLGILGRDDG